MTAIPFKWLPIFTVLLASACGERGGAVAQRSSAPGAGTPTVCPSVTDVGETAGFTVQVLAGGTRSYGPAHICAYQATAEAGVFVSISMAPFDPAEDPITRVRSGAKTFLGGQADAERIDLGDGGYAYGSDSKSEAAARKGDRVFHAEIASTGGGIGAKKEAVIALLQLVVK